MLKSREVLIKGYGPSQVSGSRGGPQWESTPTSSHTLHTQSKYWPFHKHFQGGKNTSLLVLQKLHLKYASSFGLSIDTTSVLQKPAWRSRAP